jgi:hypothetical protein
LVEKAEKAATEAKEGGEAKKEGGEAKEGAAKEGAAKKEDFVPPELAGGAPPAK